MVGGKEEAVRFAHKEVERVPGKVKIGTIDGDETMITRNLHKKLYNH